MNILRIHYYRDQHEIAETEMVISEKLALIQTRQAVEDIWLRQLIEELEIEKMRRNPDIIFADTVANRKRGPLRCSRLEIKNRHCFFKKNIYYALCLIF